MSTPNIPPAIPAPKPPESNPHLEQLAGVIWNQIKCAREEASRLDLEAQRLVARAQTIRDTAANMESALSRWARSSPATAKLQEPPPWH